MDAMDRVMRTLIERPVPKSEEEIQAEVLRRLPALPHKSNGDGLSLDELNALVLMIDREVRKEVAEYAPAPEE